MAATFYVSLEGNDAWSGMLPEPNEAASDGPFRTIERAQTAVRELKKEGPLTEPVRIILRGGLYFLDKPISLTAEDSGVPKNTNPRGNPQVESPVVFTAFPGEKPILSGGRRLAGWREEQVNGRTAWAIDLPEVQQGKWYFRQLFVNGSRRSRPRLPKEGFYRIEQVIGAQSGGDWSVISQGIDRFGYAEGDLQPWRNLQDVEITVLALWEAIHLRIKELDEKDRMVYLDRNSERRLRDDFSERGANYYVENVFEALTEPGQWYLDRPKGVLYYLPLPGESIPQTDIIAPYLAELVRLVGEEGEVRNIRFEGLTFAHTEWPIPPDMAAFYQGSTKVPAAITLSNVKEIVFDDCTLELLGTHAFELTDRCWEVKIAGCTIRNLGAGAVVMRDNCRRNTVQDCTIHDLGQLFHNSAALMVGKSSGNKLIHNHIYRVPWMGISIGWTWGYSEGDAYGNIIEYNHFHDIGLGELLSDIGAIYTLGVSPGTRIRYNLIHDIYRRGYGGWGIYLDEGSTDILVENNLVYRARSSGFHQHYGRDNLIRNNIFALNGDHQIERTRQENHRSFTFRNNIVYTNSQPILSDQGWGPANAEFNHNLYYDASGAPPTFAGKTLPEWQAMGMDTASVIGDPLFTNPATGDFGLRAGSPAFAQGFRQFDLSEVGPRR